MFSSFGSTKVLMRCQLTIYTHCLRVMIQHLMNLQRRMKPHQLVSVFMCNFICDCFPKISVCMPMTAYSVQSYLQGGSKNWTSFVHHNSAAVFGTVFTQMLWKFGRLKMLMWILCSKIFLVNYLKVIILLYHWHIFSDSFMSVRLKCNKNSYVSVVWLFCLSMCSELCTRMTILTLLDHWSVALSIMSWLVLSPPLCLNIKFPVMPKSYLRSKMVTHCSCSRCHCVFFVK